MKGLSSWQLYSLLLLFLLGTSVVFGIASSAKQDAWITAFISTFLGAALLWLYSKLYASHADLNWSGLLMKSFGQLIGSVLCLIYVFIFIYSAGRDLRDIGELTNTFLLPKTPIGVTMVLFQMLVSYTCFAGVERMGRLAELNIPIVFVIFLLEVILLVASGTIHLSLLTPIAAEWKPILTAAFPGNFTVPYSEAFAFAAFWSKMKPPGGFRKAAIRSCATAGFIFIVLDILAIGSIGPELFSRSFFPLMTTFHLVNIADFIQNIDPFIVTAFLIGVLFKITIFTYAACSMISDLWKVNAGSAVIPVSVIVFLFAFYMTESLSSHLFTGHEWAVWVVFMPFFVISPFLSLFVIKLKQWLA
jgi:spore germination protein (amino acid permease)